MKTSSCKAKGRKLQQYVAEQISKILDITWGKDELIRSREMSQSGVDVVLLGRAKEKFPWSVECKNTEKLNLWDAIRQARDNQQDGTDWMLVVKKNHESPVVIIDSMVFFKLWYRYLRELSKQSGD